MNEIYSSKPIKELPPTTNPITQFTHRHEVKTQIIYPLLIALIVFGSVGVWLFVEGVGSVERWSQIAIIFILIAGLVFGLMFLIVIIGFLYLVTKVLGIIPPYARIAQDAIIKINQQVKAGSNLSVRPVIEIQKFLALIDIILGRGKI